MTDNDIIKALECCFKGDKCVGHCPFHNNKHDIDICTSRLSENALDLINRLNAKNKELDEKLIIRKGLIDTQQAEIEKQQYILMGVMHSVDKWLDGDELKQDEVNRAATMREKTLQITEKQQEQIKKLENIEHFATKTIEKQEKEIERLHTLCKPTETSGYRIENGKVVFYTKILNGYRHEYESLDRVVNDMNIMLQNAYKTDEIAGHYKGKLQTAKSEAIKEFAKKVETELDERVSENIRNRNPHWYIAKRIVRETAIEMTEVK